MTRMSIISPLLLVSLVLLAACELGPVPADPAEPGPEEQIDDDVEPPRLVAINEVMAKNHTSIADASGAHPDWIELLNLEDTERDLSGYWLSDDRDVKNKMLLPEGTTLPANGYLLVFCDGDTDQSTPEEPHAPFSLRGEGEKVFLSDPDGERLDGWQYPELGDDESFGRRGGGMGAPALLEVPTPAEPND